jgi:hypothetical protein
MLVALAAAVPASAKPAPGWPAKRSGLNLFALTFGVLNANRVFCGINNIGEVCVDPTNSPVVGGGFWPKGTPDQYVFNSVAARRRSRPAGSPGRQHRGAFFDARGNQNEGDRSRSFNRSIRPTRRCRTARWCGIRRSTPVLIAGARSVQDLWVRTWDGNPASPAARAATRWASCRNAGLAWNFPTGNETSSTSCIRSTTSPPPVRRHNNPTPPSGEIAAIGQTTRPATRRRSESIFPTTVCHTNMFAAFSAAWTGDAGFNYATAVVPFAMV